MLHTPGSYINYFLPFHIARSGESPTISSNFRTASPPAFQSHTMQNAWKIEHSLTPTLRLETYTYINFRKIFFRKNYINPTIVIINFVFFVFLNALLWFLIFSRIFDFGSVTDVWTVCPRSVSCFGEPLLKCEYFF